MNKLNSKDMRARLKAEVKATMAEGVKLRLDRQEAGAAGDSDLANSIRLDQVDDYRPRARALFLAYAFIKGKTYNQAEGNCAEENGPTGYVKPLLRCWDGDVDLMHEWVEAGDKTRFDLDGSQDLVEDIEEAA